MDYDIDTDVDYTVMDAPNEQCKYMSCDGNCADCEWNEEEA